MKKINKKLQLNKTVVASLNNEQQNSLHGGEPVSNTCGTTTWVHSLYELNTCRLCITQHIHCTDYFTKVSACMPESAKPATIIVC